MNLDGEKPIYAHQPLTKMLALHFEKWQQTTVIVSAPLSLIEIRYIYIIVVADMLK